MGAADLTPAGTQPETSQAAVAESEALPPGSRDSDEPHRDGRHTESSGRQEHGGPETSGRTGRAPNPRSKEEEEGPRSAERERRFERGHVGAFRPRGERQEQREWGGGASQAAGQQQPRGGRGQEAEQTPPKRHGQQQGGRSSSMRSPSRTRQRERRDCSWSRSPDGHHTRREQYAGERAPTGRQLPRTWREHLDAWSPSPERWPRRETSRREGRGVHEPPTVQWGRTEGRGESRERRYESGGSRQESRTEGGTLARGAERAREAREGMQRARDRP
ncbi:unnamed protein product [Closterium sp. Naga37s-1]|nr:unnamed protein product [Closterium sp. Naga37s-1]